LANKYDDFLQNLNTTVERLDKEGLAFEDKVIERKNAQRTKIPMTNQNIGVADTPTTKEMNMVMPGGGDDYVTDSKNQEAQGWYKGAKSAYGMASKNAQLGQAWYDFKEGDRSPEKIAQINQLRKEIYDIAAATKNDPYTAKAVGQLAPYIEMSMKEYGKGGMIGAMLGGSAALIAGQAGPQAALPEEAITVPALAALGAKIGGTFSSLESMRKIEAGSAYGDLVEKGVHPDIAYKASEVYGGVSVALEAGQLALLKRIIPGGHKLGKTVIDEAFTQITQKLGRTPLVKAGVNLTGAATGEATVEATQEFMQNLVGLIAEKSDKKLRESGATPETIKEYQEALTKGVAETFATTLVGMGITGLPGTSVNLVTDTVSGKKKMKELIDKTPEDQTVAETVQEEEAPADDGGKDVPPPKKEPAPPKPPAPKKEKMTDEQMAETLGLTLEQYLLIKDAGKKTEKAQKKEATKKGKSQSHAEEQRRKSGSLQLKKAKQFGLIPDGKDPNSGRFQFTDPESKNTFTTESLLDEDIEVGLNKSRGIDPEVQRKKDIAEEFGQDVDDEARSIREKMGLVSEENDKGDKLEVPYNQLTKVAVRTPEGDVVQSENDVPGVSPSTAKDDEIAAITGEFERLSRAMADKGLNSKEGTRGYIINGKFVPSYKIAVAKRGKMSLADRAEAGKEKVAQKKQEQAVNEELRALKKEEKEQAKMTTLRDQAKKGDEVAIDKILKTNKVKYKARQITRMTLGKDMDPEVMTAAGNEAVYQYMLKLPEEVVNDYARGKMDKVVETVTGEDGKKKNITVRAKVEGGALKAAEYAMRRAMMEEHGQRTGMTERQVADAIAAGTFQSPTSFSEGGKVQDPDGLTTKENAKVIGTPKTSTPVSDTKKERVDEDVKAPSAVRRVTKEELEATRKAQQEKTDAQRERAKKFVERTRLDERPEVTKEKAEKEALKSKPVQLKETPKQKVEALAKKKQAEKTAAKSKVAEKGKETKGVKKPEVKPLKGETAKQAVGTLTKQHKEQIAATDKTKFTQRVIMGLQKAVKRAAAGKPITMWRGQPDADIAAGTDVGIHLSSTKAIPNEYFVGKRRGGGTNVLKKVRTTGPLNLLITNDAGVAWDNPDVLIDAAKFAKGVYGKENDAKLKQLVKAIQDAKIKNQARMMKAEKADDADAMGEIMAQTVQQAIQEAGFDGIAYENLAENQDNKMHNINYMIMNADKIEVIDTREQGKTAPKPKPKKVSKTETKPAEGAISMDTPVQEVAKAEKKDSKLEKEIEDLKKKLPKDMTKGMFNLDQMGSTPIFSDVANAIHDASKKVADIFDVEAPWKRMGADQTGFAIKNLFSRRESEETRTVKLAKEFMDIVVADFGRGFTKNDLADIVRSAEKDQYRRSLEPEQRARVDRAAAWMRDYFDTAKERLLERGIDVNFKERMLDDLRMSILETDDRQKQVKIMQRIREIKRMEFTHIPLAMWTLDKVNTLIRATGQKEFNKANAKLKQLTAQKRRALSINNLIEKGILDPEKVNPIEVILSYGSRMGQDMALADIRDAAINEGLIKVRKTKPRKQKLSGFTDGRGVVWAQVPDRLSALKPYGKQAWIRADVLNAIDNAYGAIHKQTKYDKAVAILKMSAFYNPFFLPAYDLVQFAMTGAPAKFWKAAPAMKQAIQDVWSQNENYFEAQAAGLSSKPFNMPFSKIKEEAARISTGKTAGRGTLSGALMSYIYKAIEQAPDLRHGSVLKTMYQASWDMAWFGDSVIRQMTYNFLKAEGISTQDAAQTAAKFHGDYASVPPATRKTLNRFLFTPTFKIAMGKLYYEMAKSPIEWAINKAKGKKTSDQKRIYAIGALGTVAVNLAFDALMNSFGFEQDEWGRKYKKVVQTEEGPRELVLTWSSPSNMIQRYLFKVTGAADPAQENKIKKFATSLSYEITPLIKNTYAVIANDKGGGEQIYSEFDTPLVQTAKLAVYALTSSFQILKVAMGDSFTESYSTQEANDILNRDLNMFWNFMRNAFAFSYTRSTEDRRKAAQIMAKARRFSQEMRKDARRQGEIDEEKIKNFEKIIMQMAEEK